MTSATTRIARFQATAVATSALAVLTLGVAACSSGPAVVSKDDVASQISAKMTDGAGNKPDSVSCPDDLKAVTGTELNCAMKVKGQPFNVNVKVTTVDGDKVNFDMVETVDKDVVASQIVDQLKQQFGREPQSLTCPDNLKGTEGATLRCDLTDEGQTYGVTVTVTGVDAGDVSFDFKVDDEPK